MLRNVVSLVLPLALHFTSSLGSPCAPPSLPLPASTVFQFELGSWIENLAVRASGDLLVSLISPTPSIVEISGVNGANATATLVNTFDSVTGLLGIIETAPDIFAVVGGNFTESGAGIPGTFSAFSIDFNAAAPEFSNIAEFPEASFLNGLEVSKDKNFLLAGDAALGKVWRVSLTTGEVDVALELPEMLPPANSVPFIGINGIFVKDGFFYWALSPDATIFRIKVTPEGLAEDGASVELYAKIEAALIDDFEIGKNGIAWAVTNLDNKLFAIRPDGTSQLVLGGDNDTTIAGGTAARFGRTSADDKILYVSTSGALGHPVNGTFVEGAKVVRVNTKGFA
ncbi:uncharacterized protein FOBCDRAFT_279792 [Fusarium oxysporum Fo47]|uniref:SMP-30/Gluconolactonase/LRE-like region domain-containing protein n=2 Tax=Fusarium oxysporum TaxID=5507 RepID=A0A8H5ELA6_FUSOX|nr:uncharacterized protein FOBCDRAFT_279792 [Fusarium oxysporum Fo47]EWZ33068.1 hypothetical protein FOZG_14563 [Fusarium oxysporum Fo47]KAF5264649.1 hypothetical protein FOXYS1_4559 [Fusarium oxysporum]QKD60187.1 hypothetical protein FOBCDRAFT_279792 [Fusarium oxysporum Fo47]